MAKSHRRLAAPYSDGVIVHPHLEPFESANPDDSSKPPDGLEKAPPFPVADQLNTTALSTAIEVKLPPFHGD